MRSGQIHKEDTTLEVKENTILMQFLLQSLKHKSRDNVKSLLREKKVWVNGLAVTQFNHELHPGNEVVIKWDPAGEAIMSRHLRIVYEDEYIIVIEKNAGLLSIATESEKDVTAYSILSKYLKQQSPANKVFIVHRLDRDTSGLMMFCKSEKIQSLLQKDWKNNITERTYMAVVEGRVMEPEGTIRSYIFESKALVMHSSQNPDKGELAITHFKTLKSNNNYSLLEINLETGKKNQIRLHLQDLGHCIAGDKKYGASGNPMGRLGLHASVLAFNHPVTGKPLRFESKIPAKFRYLV